MGFSRIKGKLILLKLLKKEGGEKGDCEDKREIRLIRKVIEGYNFTFGEVKLVRIEGEHL